MRRHIVGIAVGLVLSGAIFPLMAVGEHDPSLLENMARLGFFLSLTIVVILGFTLFFETGDQQEKARESTQNSEASAPPANSGD
ncbi:hypothetical protein [Salipiger sp. PrR003]|uniref:hypothetical protein n=1 Tax=Salipiger sp. PrR003 TaxID=2706776 RepID=UPI0013DB2567|nr:hypothetical protein [Salipiger sp. PrR003]NDV51535.1 hypothetical protein [Salipiger sp. PrR003]